VLKLSTQEVTWNEWLQLVRSRVEHQKKNWPLPRLRAIIETLSDGLSSALWVMLLIVILNYILACLGMILFQRNDPFHFGSLGAAFFSVWRAESLDSWDQMLNVNIYGCATFPGAYPMASTLYPCRDEQALGGIAVIYFIFTVIFGGLTPQHGGQEPPDVQGRAVSGLGPKPQGVREDFDSWRRRAAAGKCSYPP